MSFNHSSGHNAGRISQEEDFLDRSISDEDLLKFLKITAIVVLALLPFVILVLCLIEKRKKRKENLAL